MDDFDKEYEAYANEMMKQAPSRKENEFYKEFSEDIEHLGLEVVPSQMDILGDDIQVEQNVLEMIDPINKQLINNPVRNLFCNHVYEEKSIQDAIKVNSGIRCPYLGCGNKRPVRNDHLKKDEDLRRKIEEANKQRENEEIFDMNGSDNE